MAPPSRISVAKRLAACGLRKTLVTIRSGSGYAVNRIRKLEPEVELASVGSYAASRVPVIGRVGIPDPQLGIPWKSSMAFYGKWFDEIGETDPGYQLRRNISSLSRERMLQQVARDDKYALVGSYYSVFLRIMEIKKRVPLVLMSDAYLPLVSFPVVLPEIEDQDVQQTLLDVLRRMLRPDPPASGTSPQSAAPGIEVDEL